MTETLIVPGLNGSPEGHWQRHWVETDPGSDIVEQENWSRPILADWLHALEARIAGSEPGVILVAHSLGCALVAALAGRPAAHHVGGALLVAPADVPALAETHPSVWSFAGARGHVLPFASILVASRNDPFMHFEEAERQAALWGSALVDLGEVGHVNIASGHGAWPEGRILADGLRSRQAGSVPGVVATRPRRLWQGEPSIFSARAFDAGLGVN
ncbi:alpha/beta hydrolase [Aureimonas psammosilenae]|uniref:alpha/beta hydrolase n=1 Tax=Aureimonas psammosilenae TaxID=2495496 RepID=UPI001260FF99|nr:alpha/beta hydrolase [Aureimonas psammosilenae]